MKRIVILFVALLATPAILASAQDSRAAPEGPRRGKPRPATLPEDVRAIEALSIILGRPTDTSVTINVLSANAQDGYIEYGLAAGKYTAKTDTVKLPARTPVEILLKGLDRNKQHFYRLRHRMTGETGFGAGAEHSFCTQRAPGSTYTFEIQGDSHPERPQQHDPALYVRTLLAAAADRPDFYLTIGDDFSVDTLETVNGGTVETVYRDHRRFLGLIGQSAPLFLVNGNHEQAAASNLDGTANNVAVWAQTARNRFFPQPAPDNFYTGDATPVEHIGLLRDYYAWTWGDATFVVIDPYWHSVKPVDNVFGGGAKSRDMWAITLGDEQYNWFRKTLESSKAKYKFVFTHHILGTGRGGIEQADLFEWGGNNKKGVNEFARMRPAWAQPIHQLMAANGVTIFFQGHDHVFARQVRDGVVYQTLPEPADPSYALYNQAAYRSGDILPNSGRVRVTVSPNRVRVEYIRSRLLKDATKEHPDGEVAFAYEIPAAGSTATSAPATNEGRVSGVLASGAALTELAKSFQFTEGPAVDKEGNVFFSDVHASRIYRWSPDGKVSLFRENTGGANGLAFNKDGNLLACEGAGGRVVSIDTKGNTTAVADKYRGKRFNQPNDLWIDPKGGVYFTDPIYGRAEKTQDGEHVYYVTSDRKKTIRVIDDMVRPNGLAGTPDGKTLYVADHGAGKTFRYAVNDDGTLRDKTLFVSNGSDGMKLDAAGNVYLTTDAILVYNPEGKQIARIEVPQQPTNLCFTDKKGTRLFITARSVIYAVEAPTASVTAPASDSKSVPRTELGG